MRSLTQILVGNKTLVLALNMIDTAEGYTVCITKHSFLFVIIGLHFAENMGLTLKFSPPKVLNFYVHN